MADKGMREVVAAETQISDIDGEAGTPVVRRLRDRRPRRPRLVRGGRLPPPPPRAPDRGELEELNAFLADERELHPFLAQLMPTLAQQTSPMSMLRTAVSAASAFDPDGWDECPEAQYRKALRLIAKTPSLIATYHRLRTGQEIVPPNPSLPHAANFLWMLHGEEPDPEDAGCSTPRFVLYADHTMNASTFTARIVASTLSDMFSRDHGAIGALKGPLHGGANEEAMKSSRRSASRRTPRRTCATASSGTRRSWGSATPCTGRTTRAPRC